MARGSIVKRGSNYSIVYYVDDKQRQKTIGPNKKEAQRAFIEVMRAVYRDEYSESPKISFSEFTQKWLNNYARGTLKESTFWEYERKIKKHLIPFFGHRKLVHIPTESVQEYISRKLQEGKLKPKTINNTLVILKEMLKHAVLWGYLRKNPAKAVGKLRTEKNEMDFLNPKEIRLFLEEAKKVNSEYYPLFVTAVLTGMRRGELLALKWDDIDWNSSTIFVRRSLYKGGFVTPKSQRSVRKIVMPPMLNDVLFAHRINCPGSTEDLIFCNNQGKPLDPSNLINRVFVPALRRAGLRRIRFHDLRHIFSALLIAQGENIKYIQNQSGHASIKTTLDTYGHLLPETHTQAALRAQEAICGENYISKILANGGGLDSSSKKSPLKVVGRAGFEPATTRPPFFLARLIPIISFDVISYVSGLTVMGFWEFFIARGLGRQFPATPVYYYLGQSLTGTIKVIFWAFVLVIAFLVVGIALRSYLLGSTVEER